MSTQTIVQTEQSSSSTQPEKSSLAYHAKTPTKSTSTPGPVSTFDKSVLNAQSESEESHSATNGTVLPHQHAHQPQFEPPVGIDPQFVVDS